MPEQPSGVIVQQYEHRSVRESIDAAYLDTVLAAVELQNYLDDPRGNPMSKFRTFYRAFLYLFTMTAYGKSMASAGVICEKISAWLEPEPGGNNIKARAASGIKLWQDYHKQLLSTSTITVGA